MLDALILNLLLGAIGAVAALFIIASLFVLWKVFIVRIDR